MGTLHCNPLSDESLALIKGWIENCRRSHQPVCRMPQRQQVGGPKRLLQCLPEGVRLMETQSLPRPCSYIALSYCWGDATAVLKTTMETLERHQSGILDKNLPPLYKEVVALARQLKIANLWIDALCIVQDSTEDKEKEIMQMSNIYAGALIVVVAASAESPLGSLMRVKPPFDQSRIWRTASTIRYKKMDLNVKFRKRDWKAHWYTGALFNTHTGARAWCFQEKQVANRCLVFLDDEMVWECRSSGCQCECGGEQEHFSAAYEQGITMVPYEKRLLPSAEQEDPFHLDGTLKHFANNEVAYKFWDDVVVDFSRGALSFANDRLPAISAVASVVAKATGDRYLAGLWRDDLLAGLIWIPRMLFSGLGLHRHQEYIAPTWSWASLRAGVLYYPPFRRSTMKHDADLDASVLDAWTTLEGQNLYGSVSDAAIVLSALHCDAGLTIPERGFDAQLDFGDDDVQTVGLGPYFHALDSMRVVPDDNVDRYLRHVVPDRVADRQAACSGTVHLLWLTENTSLILTPSRQKKGASGETAYERLGVFYENAYKFQRDRGQLKTSGILKPPKMPKTAQRSRITLV